MKDAPKKNILAIDFGSVHVGLAISQTEGLPLGLTSFSNQTEGDLIEEIKKIIEENLVDLVVFGLPLSQAHGQKQAEIIEKFQEKLKAHCPKTQFAFQNENFTSKLAGHYAQKEKEHQEAARIILEDYLVQKGKMS